MTLNPFLWFADRLAKHLRQTDVDYLWPECKARAGSLIEARTAFAYHAYNDDAWLRLGRDEIERQIKELD
jgi:hypothetical protein